MPIQVLFDCILFRVFFFSNRIGCRVCSLSRRKVSFFRFSSLIFLISILLFHFFSHRFHRSNSQAEFLYHEILHSSKMDSTALEAAKITCPLCKKQFSKASLRCHLRQHTDERIFPCELCPMSFTRKANLKNHVANVHTRKQQVNDDDSANQTTITPKLEDLPESAVCATCGKAFSNR